MRCQLSMRATILRIPQVVSSGPFQFHFDGCEGDVTIVNEAAGVASSRTVVRRGGGQDGKRPKPYDKAEEDATPKKTPVPPLAKVDILCAFPAEYFETLSKYLSGHQMRVAGKLVRQEKDLDAQRAVLLSSMDIVLLKVNRLHAKDVKLCTLVRDQRRKWYEECQLEKGFSDILGPPLNSAGGGANPSPAVLHSQTKDIDTAETDPEKQDDFNLDDDMDTNESETSGGGAKRRVVTVFKKSDALSEV
jgi:hypothetical protein